MLIVEEALELLASADGRQKILAEALSRASATGATRNDIDAAKEMRQCALAAAALLEREELERLAARMEAAVAAAGGEDALPTGGAEEAGEGAPAGGGDAR
jgi:predicted PP-loop superfamily ATPase